MSGLAKPAADASLAFERVFEQIAARLREAGTTYLFGVPGGGQNLTLIDAADRAGLPFVLTSTETAGALAALAQAEITGRPGACLTTLGPGVASVVNGVAAAFLERAPLLVFTDSHPAVFEHQRLDHASLLAPVTKWSATLTPDTAIETIARAVDIATAPPPGPVHLDCPGGPDASGGSSGVGSTSGSAEPAAPANRDAIREMDELLAASRKPLLLVGVGARGADDARAIRALCKDRHVPAMVTYKGKGVVPDGHPWFAGVFTNAVLEQPLVDEGDLLIGLGLDPVELLPRAWKHPQPIVYGGPWAVSTRHVPFAVQLVTSAASAAQHVSAQLRRSDWEAEQVCRIVAAQRHTIASIPANGSSLTALEVVEISARLLAPDSRVAVDAGAHMFPATILWPVADPRDMLISNGLSTMGFALPAALGAALADRSRRVVALTGDGGLLMCLGELQTAVRERLPVVVIVFADASLSLIDVKQRQRGLVRKGVDIGAVDWPSLAAAFGMHACRACTGREMENAIEAAVDAGSEAGPRLIEARIDPGGYGAMLRAIRG